MGGRSVETPIYHLEGVVKAKEESMEDFVGPLDLILHLLSKNKLEIKDIQISLILDQYLEWMNQRRKLDLEVASEFVTMASHLIYIKTRMLLSVRDEEAMSEMEQLIATLEAHQRNENYLKIKAVVPALDTCYQIGRDYLTKVPETVQPDKVYRYVHDKEDLLHAMSAVLDRADNKLPPPVSAFQGIVGREPYPCLLYTSTGGEALPPQQPAEAQASPLRRGAFPKASPPPAGWAAVSYTHLAAP